MHLLGKMPFAPLDHQPGDGQRAFGIDQTNHQGDTLVSHLTPVNHKDQFTHCRQVRQQLAHKRQVKSFLFHLLMLHPPAVAFDPAVGFGRIRRFPSNRRQLTTACLHNPRHQPRQGRQSAGKIAFRFSRKQLFQGHSNGTIHSTIVHRFTPFFPGRMNLSVPDWAIVIS